MPNLSSTKRIIEYLQIQDQPVTPTQIYKDTKVSYFSVLKSIDFLDEQEIIDSVSNGRIKLISIKEGRQKKEDDNESGYQDQSII